MTPTASALLVLAAAVAAVDWWAVATSRLRAELVAKPAALVALVGVALAVEPVDGGGRTWLVVALVLCLLGDVLLVLPRDAFVPGLAAFLLGHLAYVVAFWPLASSWVGAGAALVVAVSLMLSVLPRAVAGARREGGAPLAVAVVVYALVIAAMATAAGASGSAWGWTGAALFVVSDAVLAWNRFVRPLPHGHLAVMVTYHLAQASLVLAFVS
ncbi:lysoplasmalogenase family protein [Solicola sp. PLA-1-18]|uniref:lysoplasmalogenase family protein n=1 Tax=Solicola sp. PLA-1-18 TaxID=3380532 RepID=UPI003B7E5E73